MTTRIFKTTVFAACAAGIAAIALFFSAQPTAQAFFGFGDKKQAPVQAKEYYIHDDATFQKDTKSYDLTPFGKADLEYDIQLPQDWHPEDLIQNVGAASTEALLGDIARYESPMIGTQQLRVRIQATKLDTEIAAPDWLENYMLANSFTIQGGVIAENMHSAHSAYISIVDGTTYYNYIAARMSGSYILTARFESPINLKNYVAYVGPKIIDSFRILYPKEDPVETQRVFTLVDAMKFNYPDSWIITSNQVHDMSRMSVDLQCKNMNGDVEGYVRFMAIRRSPDMTIMKAIAEQKKYINDVLGLKVVKLLSSNKTLAYTRFIFNRMESYEVVSTKSRNTRPQEIQFAMLGDKEFYIFGIMFTQEKDSNLLKWARNTQSFRLMLQSIK